MAPQKLNRVGAIVPILLSLLAFGIVMFSVRTGWGNGSSDEGAGAHIFWLLIIAQLPFVVMFAATTDWRKLGRVAGVFAFQAAAVVLAFAPVAFFKL